VPRRKLAKAREILERWQVGCHVLGEITTGGLMRVRHKGRVVAEIPAGKISDDSPCYVRVSRKPRYLERITQFSEERFPPPNNYEQTLLRLLASPTIASKRWVYEQYDHMVQTNTIVPPGHSAAVLRIKETKKHIALTSDCNGLYCYLDPRTGAAIAVAEAARNLVCAGAEPLAITNCLNFGNPEKPEIFYQFEQCVKGMAAACRKLRTPVTGGNVSFYNEYRGVAVFPTPVIGMLGLIENENGITTVGFKDEGDVVLLAGASAEHLGGSHYWYGLRKKILGPCPRIDLDFERRLHRFVLRAIRAGLIKSAQDLSEGGLAVALSESCILSDEGLGAEIVLPGNRRPDIELFSEAQSRIVLSCDPDHAGKLKQTAHRFRVPIRKIGIVASSSLKIASVANVAVTSLRSAYFTEPFE
jgi:phosphoribosylformylglycinamidine synthase II